MDHERIHEIALELGIYRMLITDLDGNKYVYQRISNHEYRFGLSDEKPDAYLV